MAEADFFFASEKRHGGAGSSHNKKRLLKHEMLQQPFNYYYWKEYGSKPSLHAPIIIPLKTKFIFCYFAQTEAEIFQESQDSQPFSQ